MKTTHSHARLEWRGQPLAIRDLLLNDVETIARYWSAADDGFLRSIGVDREKLGDHQAIAARYRDMIPTGDATQAKVAFVIELAGRLVGYTNLHSRGPRENVSHWHLIDPVVRGRGLSTTLYPHRLSTYFARPDIELLMHQTPARNRAMNRLLDHFVPVAETRFLAAPDGLAEPGEFNIRYVERADLPRIFAAAEALK